MSEEGCSRGFEPGEESSAREDDGLPIYGSSRSKDLMTGGSHA